MKPVVALDIDGTLVDYHSHFIAFARQYFPLRERAEGWCYDARLPFHKFLGVSKEKYRQCKMAYRRGEQKRSVPLLPLPYPQADDLTRQVRSWGCDIWLCTTRPYLAYDAIDSATRHNLKRNGVHYNGIIWGERKYHELVRTVGRGRVVGVLDDLPEMCLQAERLKLRTGFAVRPHNVNQWSTLRMAEGYQGISEVGTHEDTLALLRGWLDSWRAEA